MCEKQVILEKVHGAPCRFKAAVDVYRVSVKRIENPCKTLEQFVAHWHQYINKLSEYAVRDGQEEMARVNACIGARPCLLQSTQIKPKLPEYGAERCQDRGSRCSLPNREQSFRFLVGTRAQFADPKA